MARFYIFFIFFLALNSLTSGQVPLPDTFNKSPFDLLWLKSRMSSYLMSNENEENDIEALLSKGQKNLQSGLYQNALETFRKANQLIEQMNLNKSLTNIQKYNYLHPLFYMAICKEALNDKDSAILLLDKVIGANPLFSEAYNEKGVISLSDGNFNTAIDLFQQAIKVNTSYDGAYYNLGYTYFLKNNFNQAKKFLNKAIDYNAKMDIAYALLGNINERISINKLAIKNYNKAIEANPKSFAGYYWRGIYYYKQENYENALADMQAFINLDPNNFSGIAIVGDIQMKLNHVTEAIAMFARLFESILSDEGKKELDFADAEFFEIIKILNSQKLYDSELDVGRALFKEYYNFQFKKFKPIEQIQQLAQQYPWSLVCQRFYFLALYQNGQYEDYINRMSTLFDINDTLPNHYMMVGNIFYEEKKYTNAMQCIGKALRYRPDNAAYYLNVGLCYSNMGKNEDALNYLDKAIDRNENYAYAYIQKARVNIKLRNLEQAVANSKAAIKIFPREYNYYIFTGETYNLFYKNDSALVYFTKAINLDTSNVQGYLKRAETWVSSMNYDNAYREIDTALIVNHSSTDTYETRGRLNMQLKKYIEAIDDFTSLINLSYHETLIGKTFTITYNTADPNTYYRYVLRADAYLKIKNYKKAIADYKEAIRLSPWYLYALRQIANTYKFMNDSTEAMKYYNRALDHKTASISNYMADAFIYNDMGKFADAVKNCEMAISQDSGYASAWGNMGWNYYEMNEFEKCILFSQKAIDLDSTALYAMYNIALSELRLGNYEKSKQLYIKYKEINKSLREPIDEGAIEDLENLINKGVLTDECKFIIQNILKY